MKLLWYLMMFVFGFLGAAGALRSAELIATGGQVNPTQILVVVIFIGLAAMCMLRARGPKTEEQ